MYIINSNNVRTGASQQHSSFTIILSGKVEGRMIAKELKFLTNDEQVRVWKAFEGSKAKQLQRSAIEGLIVFLSCECKNNVISGEFVSLDGETAGALLTHYVHEIQRSAFIDISAGNTNKHAIHA